MKKIYIKPEIEVVHIETESLLATSIMFSSTPTTDLAPNEIKQETDWNWDEIW